MEESVGFVVVLVAVGGFLGRGSFFPNCQSDEVVEQLFALVSFISSSVVFDVDGSLVDEVVPEVGPDVGPEVEPEPVVLLVDEVEPEVDPRRIDLTGIASRACRKGVEAAFGLFFCFGGLLLLESVVAVVDGTVEVSELVEDGSFGLCAFCVWFR